MGRLAGNSGQVNWMPEGQPRGMITTILDGFKQLAPEGCEVVYSRGTNIIDLVDDPEGEFYPDGQPRPKLAVSAKFDQQLLDEAVDNARHSDLVVAVVGDVVQLVGETCSTTSTGTARRAERHARGACRRGPRDRQAAGRGADKLQAAGDAGMRDRHEWRDRGRIHGRWRQRVHVGAESRV